MEVLNNMQNDSNKRPNAFIQFLRDKGYYIVLVLCVAVAGVSGFLFVRTLSDKDGGAETVNLSVPLTPAGERNQPVAEPKTAPAPEAPKENAAETMAPADELPAASFERAAPVRPVAGEVVNAWAGDHLAYNETLRDWRVHEGVDFAAAMGAEVAAARDGMVSAVYEDDLLGVTVALEHTGGYTSYYSNLSADPPVTVGQAVSRGDVIGTVGGTAAGENALGGHLHFAVNCSGQSMDPLEFLE